jgi:serine/threonine protein kinase
MSAPWERVEKIFSAAAELPAAERAAYLDSACGADEELRREVESLFSHDGPSDPFVAAAVAEAALTQKFPTGQMVCPYRISGILGEGGMWIVYKAEDTRLGRAVALKFVKIQVSSEGGTDPIWSRDGKELLYRNGDKRMAVAVATQPAFRASKPRRLWEGKYSQGMSSSCGPPGTTSANYDVTGDGQRFLMVKDLDQDAISARIVVVPNFAEELKRLAAAAKSK